PESGEIGGEIMADFLNSSIDGPNAALLAAADGDTFLLRVSEDVGTASWPVLYRRAPDIDLAQITTLELAHAFPLDASLRTFIAAYNRSHADCRILVADYSDRNTDDDPLAGANALAFAIAAGTDRPDLVIGVPGAEDVGLLIRKSLCADLMPVLKQDDFLTPDNVFCAVKTAYAADGILWGLPLSFTVSSLYSTRDILGSLADGDGWTVGELLDFAESLPSDVRLFNGLSRENAADSLLGPSGYRLFLDRKRAKCAFDSPEFLRWLNFLASLPSYRDAEHIRDNEQLYGLYHTRKSRGRRIMCTTMSTDSAARQSGGRTTPCGSDIPQRTETARRSRRNPSFSSLVFPHRPRRRGILSASVSGRMKRGPPMIFPKSPR
ncbi:MAG: hypothetical protein IKZ41_06445, partial [Clostridia bacterium]|nr:hypothetical protein [Clostridia bacterium]